MSRFYLIDHLFSNQLITNSFFSCPMFWIHLEYLKLLKLWIDFDFGGSPDDSKYKVSNSGLLLKPIPVSISKCSYCLFFFQPFDIPNLSKPCCAPTFCSSFSSWLVFISSFQVDSLNSVDNPGIYVLEILIFPPFIFYSQNWIIIIISIGIGVTDLNVLDPSTLCCISLIQFSLCKNSSELCQHSLILYLVTFWHLLPEKDSKIRAFVLTPLMTKFSKELRQRRKIFIADGNLFVCTLIYFDKNIHFRWITKNIRIIK